MYIKYLLAAGMIFHGLIHLLGGFSELQIAKFNNLSEKTLVPLPEGLRKILGTLWLFALILFICAALGLTFSQPWWKTDAAAAVIISQILIILWWPDAKYGTLPNLTITLGLIFIK